MMSRTGGSLSARRAWIEIITAADEAARQRSLSARRAWIEMIDYVIDYVNDAVALRKESVDRNTHDAQTMEGGISRSPQGERG